MFRFTIVMEMGLTLARTCVIVWRRRRKSRKGTIVI